MQAIGDRHDSHGTRRKHPAVRASMVQATSANPASWVNTDRYDPHSDD
jgi:hypothetical protein